MQLHVLGFVADTIPRRQLLDDAVVGDGGHHRRKSECPEMQQVNERDGFDGASEG
jgi:hypothetical protein